MKPPELPNSAPSPLDGVRAKLGLTPRKLGWFEKAPIAFEKPEWLRAEPEDQMNNVFAAFRKLWKRGVVLWAHVVMANGRLYFPGDSDLPGEVLYSLTQDDAVAASQLLQFGERLIALRGAEEPDPAWSQRERELSDDLASEMAWHAGFRLPDHWAPNSAEYRLNTVMFHRAHLPGGVLRYRLLPLLVLPEVPFHSIVVPREYWTEELLGYLETYCTRQRGSETRHEQLEDAYVEVFGAIDTVLHETEARHAHVDVYQFAPNETRDFWTLVSAGMSKLPQPGGTEGCPSRTEVVLYTKVKTRELGELVRNTAHYPFEAGQALGNGHTVGVEQSSAQIFGSNRFPAILFLASTRREDRHFVGKVAIEGEPVFPLMMVPLLEPELNFYRTNGLDAFMEAVAKSSTSIVFDPARESVV